MTGTDSARSIFLRFLRFGALAWGGPAAQIAMIKRECVDEEGWVADDTFRKTLAVYQVLPGPEAHELCVYFGRLRGGKLGAFLAGLGFMLPGFVLMFGRSAPSSPGRWSGSADPSSRMCRWRYSPSRRSCSRSSPPPASRRSCSGPA